MRSMYMCLLMSAGLNISTHSAGAPSRPALRRQQQQQRQQQRKAGGDITDRRGAHSQAGSGGCVYVKVQAQA
jgi:hypothetical protein